MPTFQMEPSRVADRTEPSHVLECQVTASVAYGKGNRISGSRCRRNFRSQARRFETAGHSITDYCQSERSHKQPGVSQPKDLLSVYHGSQKIDQVGSSTEGPLSPSVSSGLIERSPVRRNGDKPAPGSPSGSIMQYSGSRPRRTHDPALFCSRLGGAAPGRSGVRSGSTEQHPTAPASNLRRCFAETRKLKLHISRASLLRP